MGVLVCGAMPLPKLFDGYVITLGRSVPISEKSQLNSSIRKYGGKISAFLNQDTTHYLTTEWDQKSFQSDPFQCKILHLSFLGDSIEQQNICDEDRYRIFPHDVDSEKDLVQLISRKGCKNMSSLKFMVELFHSQTISSQETDVKKPVNKSLERIRETMIKREEGKRFLEEPVNIASIEIPTFEFQILSDDKDDIKETEEFIQNDFDSFGDLFNLDTSSTSSGDSLLFESDVHQELEDVSQNTFSSLFQDVDKRNKKEKERRRIQDLEEKKRRKEEEERRIREKRAEKKKEIRENIRKNAEEGRIRQYKINMEREEKLNEKKNQKLLEKLEKQRIWEAEQAKRHEEWINKKEIMRQQRKEKKKAFSEKKEKILAQDKEEKGRKLFVGKIQFNDILSDDTLNEFKKRTKNYWKNWKNKEF